MWDWAVWVGLGIGVLAAAGAAVFLGVRSLAVWRQVKAVRRGVVDQLEELGAKGEATAEKVAATGDTVELQESAARLRVSLARLAVLREAIDEAQDSVGRLTAVMPRK